MKTKNSKAKQKAPTAVRCSVLVSSPQSQSRNVSASLDCCGDIPKTSEQGMCSRPGVEGHFHRLLSCEHHIRDWARSDRLASIWKTILTRWQVAGCPNPQTWPDHQKYLIVEAYDDVMTANCEAQRPGSKGAEKSTETQSPGSLEREG